MVRSVVAAGAEVGPVQFRSCVVKCRLPGPETWLLLENTLAKSNERSFLRVACSLGAQTQLRLTR